MKRARDSYKSAFLRLHRFCHMGSFKTIKSKNGTFYKIYKTHAQKWAK